MKATVIVTLKPTVLDPQGITIQRSAQSLGLTEVTEIRQGKILRRSSCREHAAGTCKGTGAETGEGSTDQSGD